MRLRPRLILRPLRLACHCTAVAGAIVPSLAMGQEWVVYGGVAGRVEYSDNYFFVDPDAPVNGTVASKESALTLTVIPFVAAARRTETSEVTALLSVGGNKVWGPSPTEEYLSGSLLVNGTLREERSTWSGAVSYTRLPQLQNVLLDNQVSVALAYTDAASASGSYSYAVSERWTAGATAGAFANRYDSVVADSPALPDDSGFSVGGNLRYLISEQTQATSAAAFSYYTSDETRSDVVTASIGIAHQFSPQLTVSATVGGYWSDTTARRAVVGQEGPILPGTSRTADGPFYGASLRYEASERTQIDAGLSSTFGGSGIGVLSKTDLGSLGLSHQFSERLTARLGGSATRTSFPAAVGDAGTNTTVAGLAGVTYQLAERWKVEAGYAYTRTTYDRNDARPDSNVVFVSVAYNWPGASWANWAGTGGAAAPIPGAGPLLLPSTPRPAGADTPSTSGVPFIAPFDTLTLP